MPKKQITKSETEKMEPKIENDHVSEVDSDHDQDNDIKSVTNTFNKNDFRNKKLVRKAGRTLIVRTLNDAALDENHISNLEGFVKKSETKNNTTFLVFDTPQNALAGLRTIKSKSENYRIKFSYYKLFFTINGLNDNSVYNDVKKSLVDYVSKQSNTSVLYCKLYCKDKKYLGCGDLTVDTLDALNLLLSKDNGMKDFKIDSLSGTFYKFNSKKEKPIGK